MKIHFEPASGNTKTLSVEVPLHLWLELQEAKVAARMVGLGSVDVTRHVVDHISELVAAVKAQAKEAEERFWEEM